MQKVAQFNGEKFIKLSLSSCIICSESFKVLAQNMRDTNIEYVDLSWNQIETDAVDDLCDFIRHN